MGLGQKVEVDLDAARRRSAGKYEQDMLYEILT